LSTSPLDELSRALRERDDAVLLLSLQRTIVEGEQEWVKDWRDLLVALAPYHDCARRLGLDPSELFDQAAAEGPEILRDTVREFGRRRDVTPEAFGFAIEDEPGGPRYVSKL
jgi:hypothetical protein